MIIPKKITIGNKEYHIKIQYFVDLFHSNIYGNINYMEGVMKIKKVKDNRAMEDTFFHELAHGLLKEMEFNYPSMVKFRNDEKFVQELGLHIRNVFIELLEKQKGEQI